MPHERVVRIRILDLIFCDDATSLSAISFAPRDDYGMMDPANFGDTCSDAPAPAHLFPRDSAKQIHESPPSCVAQFCAPAVFTQALFAMPRTIIAGTRHAMQNWERRGLPVSAIFFMELKPNGSCEGLREP